MNCADLRDRLPDLAYDAPSADEQGPITAHLRDCPDCRRQLEELRQVRGLLDAASAPAARVDIPAVYQAAAADAARRLRRWRRLALSACAAAAALLLIVFSRLEFRFESHQFVVRWQTPPTPVPPVPPQSPVVVAPSYPSAEEWRVVNALLQALVDDAKLRDAQQQHDVTNLAAKLDELQRQTALRCLSAERDIAALYTAQFPTGKGGNP